jgi:GNAT superfamily N-acetyltransferase
MLTTFADAGEFLRWVGPALEAREAEHNLILGLAQAIRPSPPSPLAFLAAVTDASGLALAALMTAPDRPLVLATDRDHVTTALEPLWNALDATGRAPRRVSAEARLGEAFVHGWQQRTGCATSLRMQQRLHVLTEVRDVSVAPGGLRVAGPSDVELVAEWMVAFDREAHLDTMPAGARDAAERRVAAGEIYLWVDGEPRSMAGRARPTTHGIAINAVYTPPEWRGRGYAASCVAQASARLLDEGRSFCVLFTDLANPTSNAIYARIGYRGIRDFAVYDLAAPAPLAERS